MATRSRSGRCAPSRISAAAPCSTIESAEHGTVLVPFTREAVPEVDLAGGRLIVAALPGLLTAVAEADEPVAEARR